MGTLSEQFLIRVETFLAASNLKVSEFGRQSVGDPSFVSHLRRGRTPTLATADKVLAYIQELEAEGARNRRNRRPR